MLNIAKLYFNILKNQYRLNADKQNIERYQSILLLYRHLRQLVYRGADSSLAKAELSKTKINYNQTLGAMGQLKEQLSYLTGIPANGLLLDTLPNSSAGKNLVLPQLLPDTGSNR